MTLPSKPNAAIRWSGDYSGVDAHRPRLGRERPLADAMRRKMTAGEPRVSPTAEPRSPEKAKGERPEQALSHAEKRLTFAAPL